MVFAAVSFVVGVVVGAFSHKWLAAEVKTTTGVDAQAAANQVKSGLNKLDPKA